MVPARRIRSRCVANAIRLCENSGTVRKSHCEILFRAERASATLLDGQRSQLFRRGPRPAAPAITPESRPLRRAESRRSWRWPLCGADARSLGPGGRRPPRLGGTATWPGVRGLVAGASEVCLRRERACDSRGWARGHHDAPCLTYLTLSSRPPPLPSRSCRSSAAPASRCPRGRTTRSTVAGACIFTFRHPGSCAGARRAPSAGVATLPLLAGGQRRSAPLTGITRGFSAR